jgi:hypothetical protein
VAGGRVSASAQIEILGARQGSTASHPVPNKLRPFMVRQVARRISGNFSDGIASHSPDSILKAFQAVSELCGPPDWNGVSIPAEESRVFSGDGV